MRGCSLGNRARYYGTWTSWSYAAYYQKEITINRGDFEPYIKTNFIISFTFKTKSSLQLGQCLNFDRFFYFAWPALGNVTMMSLSKQKKIWKDWICLGCNGWLGVTEKSQSTTVLTSLCLIRQMQASIYDLVIVIYHSALSLLSDVMAF